MKWVLLLLSLGTAAAAPSPSPQVDVSSGSVVDTVEHLRPGQYAWFPGIAPGGPSS